MAELGGTHAVAVPAASFVLFATKGRTIHVAWNASDLVDDAVVGGSELPASGSVDMALGAAHDTVLLQAPVLDDFFWRLEPVR